MNCYLVRKDCEAFRKLAFENIASVAISFLEKNPNQTDLDLSTHTVVGSSTSCDSMNDFLKDDNYEIDSEIAKETFNLRISKERIEFLNLIEISNLKPKDFCHTANFWLKKQV